MQEKNHRPVLMLIPVLWDVDLILMGRALQNHRPVEEASVLVACEGGRVEQSSKTQKEEEAAQTHYPRA